MSMSKEVEMPKADEIKKDEVKNQQIQINLDSSLIIAPPIALISPITNCGEEEFSFSVKNANSTIDFRGSLNKMRSLKANLLGAMQSNSIYICDIDLAVGEDKLSYSWN